MHFSSFYLVIFFYFLAMAFDIQRRQRRQEALPHVGSWCQNASGFALIELLVVISIIAVLASMTMAGVSLVRESARSARCLSNLRQLGMTAMSWSNDHEDFLMPAYGAITWVDQADPNFMNTMLSMGLPLKSFICPSYRGTTPNVYGENQTVIWPYNGPGSIGDGVWQWGTGNIYFHTRANTTSATIREPAQKIYYGDSSDYWLNFFDGVSMQEGRRHRGKANFVWLDGHASAEPSDFGVVYNTGTYFNAP